VRDCPQLKYYLPSQIRTFLLSNNPSLSLRLPPVLPCTHPIQRKLSTIPHIFQKARTKPTFHLLPMDCLHSLQTMWFFILWISVRLFQQARFSRCIYSCFCLHLHLFAQAQPAFQLLPTDCLHSPPSVYLFYPAEQCSTTSTNTILAIYILLFLLALTLAQTLPLQNSINTLI
jgi:hypothetical protein